MCSPSFRDTSVGDPRLTLKHTVRVAVVGNACDSVKEENMRSSCFGKFPWRSVRAEDRKSNDVFVYIMAQEIAAEGVTTFNPPSTSYRYVLQLKDDKLSIWMEDKTSKKQWSKSNMDKSDYVTSANSITDASAMDYMKCFQDALDCELGNSGDVQRTLESKRGGVLLLSFTVQFRLLRSTRTAKYTFELNPVAVERIDVLESKLRDQQEELKTLRKDVSAGRTLPFAQFEAMTKDPNTLTLLWKEMKSDFFHVEDGKVFIRRAGVYTVAVVVNSASQACNQNAVLMKNKTPIQKATCCYRSNYSCSATLNSVLQLGEDDTVSIECDGAVNDTCYLVIARLGH
ncbi:hypothetical protein P3T76_009860 [Phytophthora citrophthora]|uniref:Uncharacterized protein n=1 Tax=Phytophthora citrophthora TaxID=4793 RepID=A0AAD9GEU9_9STRA|nr:hypothetical protein P3T76_009860 [Phytophthora citrophthora]